jgi:hypothetical protein
MYKLIASLTVVLGAAFAVMAAAPTHAAVDGVYEWKIDTTIDADGAFDTLVSANDSTQLLNDWRPDQKWEYILVRDAITGTGSDSVQVEVRVDAYDASGNLLYRTAADSFTAADGEAILLDFGGTLFGHKFDIELSGNANIGSQVILNRFSIWQRRAVTVNKAW